MVELAREHSGLPIIHLRFEDVVWRDTFDGIWSCASLLHVARDNLPAIMARLAAALKSGSAWFMSFKWLIRSAQVAELAGWQAMAAA